MCCVFSLGKERARGSLYMGSPRSPLSPFALWFSCMSLLCMYANLLQLCLTLCDPMGCSPPGSSVHGIIQRRILEWAAVPSSRGSSRPRVWTCISCFSCIGRWFFTSSPAIIVINISRESNYTLCLVTPSSEHPNTALWAPGTYSFGISALLYSYVTAFCCDIMNSLYVGLVSPPTRSWKTEICLICTSIL